MKNYKNIIVIGGIIIVLLTALVVFYVLRLNSQNKEMAEVVEMMNLEKEQLEQEYRDLGIEFESYSFNIQNDSLVRLLENEQMKVRQLLEELRVTKATNARRIAELRNELATVRKVMAQYVNQIDSLNTINRELKTENIQVRRKYQAASETVEQLSKEKETLTEVVTRASILEISHFGFQALNNRGRATKRFSQIETLQFNYTVSKNITAPPGDKTLFLRITRPDGEILSKNNTNVFTYEDKNIAYSARKDFEYGGESVSDAIYWKVGEILQAGRYRADFFIDGHRVGSFNFDISK
ncbi:MAG: hypothetical protein LBH80_05990 [Prevotellaceae bacterium]|jgi:hypothetical protein|nr:hypothetical protein [Prevotellaceae bacterium]